MIAKVDNKSKQEETTKKKFEKKTKIKQSVQAISILIRADKNVSVSAAEGRLWVVVATPVQAQVCASIAMYRRGCKHEA